MNEMKKLMFISVIVECINDLCIQCFEPQNVTLHTQIDPLSRVSFLSTNIHLNILSFTNNHIKPIHFLRSLLRFLFVLLVSTSQEKDGISMEHVDNFLKIQANFLQHYTKITKYLILMNLWRRPFYIRKIKQMI